MHNCISSFSWATMAHPLATYHLTTTSTLCSPLILHGTKGLSHFLYPRFMHQMLTPPISVEILCQILQQPDSTTLDISFLLHQHTDLGPHPFIYPHVIPCAAMCSHTPRPLSSEAPCTSCYFKFRTTNHHSPS